MTIYTPGAPHGVGLNIIGTLDVPADMGDPQAVQEEVDAYVSSLLNLVAHRRRPAELPRAHPAVDDHQRRLDARPRAGPRDPGRLRAAAARAQGGRPGAGLLLPGRRPDEAGDEAQRPAGLAGVRVLAGRRADRHRVDAAHRRRAPALRGGVHRAPVRRAAAVGRVGRAGQADLLDAPAERHLRPAHPALHGRGRRLPAPGRQPAHEAARSCCCSSRRAHSASGSCSPRRTPWTSTTRPCPTPAPG